MATAGRRTDAGLAAALVAEGCSFDFFQAVRLLMLLNPDQEEVGGLHLPRREAVRFRAHRSLAFPASEIQEVKALSPAPDGTGPSMEVLVNFMGLVGPKGVLPWQYTAAAGTGAGTPLSDFFDLFHHRLISLFYRAWEQYRLPILFERNTRSTAARCLPPATDRFTACLFDIVGLGGQSLRNRQSIPDLAILRYAGLVAQRPSSASALRALLSDYFQVPVEIEQFRGRWFALAPPTRSWLAAQGLHNQLGHGAFAGDAAWNPQAAFRVRLGPLPLERFRCFLPGEPACTALIEWCRFGSPSHLDFDIQLVLQSGDVPYCRLGEEGPAPPLLGLLTWLKTEDFTFNPGDVDFRATQILTEGALPCKSTPAL